jgi:hypothetical protein
MGFPSHQYRARRNSRGSGQKGGAPVVRFANAIPVVRFANAIPVVRFANAIPVVRFANAIPNVEKAARVYGADGCVPANKKF